MTNRDQIIDLELVDGKYRRRRRYQERAAVAKLAFDAAYRRAWAIGLPMVIAAHAAFIASIFADDLGAASLMMVVCIGLREMAPKIPTWIEFLDAVPEYD